MKRLINCETGEETLVPFTEEELAQQAIDEAEANARADAIAAKAAQRQALLSRLGITEEEARILLGGN